MVHLGNEDTKNLLSTLFFVIGFTFATSFSMTRVDVVDWINTSTPKKIIRTIIGAALAWGIFWVARWFGTDTDDQELSNFFFYLALP